MVNVKTYSSVGIALVIAVSIAACSQRDQPVIVPEPPTPIVPPVAAAPPPPPSTVEEALPIPLEPLLDEGLADRSLDDLNRDSPLQPAFFALDSAELDAGGRAIVMQNAEILKRFPTWQITIEGHCDERGTAEYNLALGERRAMAVQTYLVSLGIPPNRMRTVSYGKEFPFDPRSNEEAWAQNRRAHFVITAK